MKDPRWYQIGSLALLLLWGMTQLQFDVTPARVALILFTTIATQYLCSRIWSVPFEVKSALISALSLCLLVRTNFAIFAVIASILAIATKFVIRIRGKHLFNPTNIAIVLLLIFTDRVWVSPGQWGSAAYFAFLIACAGGLVVLRARRSDVTWAFIISWSAIVIGRSLWLGEPMTIPLHRLENGALLLFTFFMISDPKTTPDSRIGRILFAVLVALGAGYIQFRLFRTNGLLWSLAGCSLLVPLIDLVFRSERFQWPGSPATSPRFPWRSSMRPVALILAVVLVVAQASPALAFCGFYVAKGDAKLFNRASQVVIARDGDRTVMTMANDFQGDPKEFAVVIPVPTVLQKGQIHVGNKAVIDHLDAYSAPRLVEYHDGDPCQRWVAESITMAPTAAAARGDMAAQNRAKALGVTIEARYTVGEYDILILSAKQSNGLETWLVENGYRMPPGASTVLGSYIKQNMKFFVARVNLTEQARLGYKYLRPIQVAYESPKFMLPIRLGTVNANGPQELFIYTLTKTGRVETTNYRTVRLPSDQDIPLYVRDRFGDFYKAMFTEQVRKEDMKAVFLEYAWDMNWCDPCAADPLTQDELRQLGVFWLGGKGQDAPIMRGGGGAQNVFVTRLHVRYNRANFPEDLVFQETGDRQNFQARYVLHHPWKGSLKECDDDRAKEYRRTVRERSEREARNLAVLTGWNVNDIRKKMNLVSKPEEEEKKWWETIWNR